MKTWTVKPSTTKELAALYQITPRIFNNWVDNFRNEVGKRIGFFYNVTQVLIILRKLGPPPDVEVIYGNKLFVWDVGSIN